MGNGGVFLLNYGKGDFFYVIDEAGGGEGGAEGWYGALSECLIRL